MTWDAPVSVTCVPGAATTSSCKVLVVTLNDPTSDNVLFTVDNVTYTGVISGATGNQFNMSPVNTDGASTVMWSGVVVPSSLAEFTRYSWVVTQTVSGVTYRDDGSFMTLPSTDTDFQMLFASCDSSGQTAAIGLRLGAHVGIWPEYRRLVETSSVPTVGLFWVDDYGYVDGHTVNDSSGNSGLDFDSTGFAVQPSSAASLVNGAAEYNYALGWASLLGMCGGDSSEADLANTKWGRATDRRWCRRNLNLYFQWGDHEFINDIGWDTAINNDPTPTWIHATYVTGVGQFDGAAWVVFSRLFGLIRPDISDIITPSDTTAKHWAIKIGDVGLLAPDSVTNSNGTSTQAYNPPVSTALSIYGNNQIDDLLDAADTMAASFTLVGMSNSLRYPQASGSTVTEYEAGAQHPIYDHDIAGYKRLITSNSGTPKSIMDNPKTNGSIGTTVFIHGDYHRSHVYTLDKASYSGNLAEDIYCIGVGTVNGSVNFTPVSEAASGSANNNVGIEYVSDGVFGDRDYWGLIINVKGSSSRKELDITLIDKEYSTVWNKKFISGRGNSAYPIDSVIVETKPSGDGAGDGW